MSETNEINRPWDLWAIIILTVLAGLGALSAIPTELESSTFFGILTAVIGIIWLFLAYGFYTLDPRARIAGILLNILNFLYELILSFIVEDRGFSLVIFMGILAAIYILYLQYRKNLFVGTKSEESTTS